MAGALVIIGTACTVDNRSDDLLADGVLSDEVTSDVVVPATSSSATTTEPVAQVVDVQSGSTIRPGDADSVVALSFDALMARRIACGFRPRECDVDTLAVEGSPLFDRLSALMEQRIAAGITASRRGSVRYRIDDVEVIDADTATVTTCLTDDTVLMSAGAIFDDSRFSAVTRWSMQRRENGWLWFEDHVVNWKRGEDLCAFEE